jgi:hypothetical protein
VRKRALGGDRCRTALGGRRRSRSSGNLGLVMGWENWMGCLLGRLQVVYSDEGQEMGGLLRDWHLSLCDRWQLQLDDGTRTA